MAEAFGQALQDHYRGERDADLYQRDGDETLRHPVADFYFADFHAQPGADWLDEQLSGPLVDLGAGAGRDALHFQGRFETVALERSGPLVTLLQERGVEVVEEGDMFRLPEQFERDRFQSALAVGTQLGLATSRAGVQSFLRDLATVTTDDATAVVDGYDPTADGASDMLGFRPDPTPGLAFRVLHYEYENLVGDTLLFRLFSPDRLREIAADTPWTVTAVRRPTGAYHYLVALEKP
jgi:hypothetical protein